MEDQKSTQLKKSNGINVVIVLLMIVICVSLVGLTVFVVLKPLKIELKTMDTKEKEGEKTVSVSGEGKVMVVSEIATVRIGSYTIAETTEKAQDENSEKNNKILSALKNLDIEEKDIQTLSYNVQPEYDWGNGKRIDKGYRASQYITVTIRDLDIIGKVLTKSAEAGANDIGGVVFKVEDIEKYKIQAINEAYKNAEERAKTMIQSAGQELGEVISMNEAGVDVPQRFMKGLGSAEVSGDATERIEPEISIGEEEITAKVEVVYEIK